MSVTSAGSPKRDVPLVAHGRLQSRWIISPFWDCVFFLVTPLAAIGVTSVLGNSRFSQTNTLLLLGIVATGHHIPGFLRAYGDPELFARYRGRLLLGPPLLIGVGLWFTSHGIPGLELIIMVWGVWHFLMQNYGIMRIYGAKRGDISKMTATMDWLIMLAWLAAVYFNNPVWSFNFQSLLFGLGVPVFPEFLIPSLGTTMTGFALFMSVAYVYYTLRLISRDKAINPLKYLLLANTLAFYIVGFHFTSNILLVTVIAELVHDLQYYSLAWVFQRRMAEKLGEKVTVMRVLFQPSLLMVMLYLFISFAYGADFSEVVKQFFDEQGRFVQVGVGVLFASTILHYYTDGFIWKVRQEKTREYLGIDSRIASQEDAVQQDRRSIRRRSLLHFACYAAIVGALIGVHSSAEDRTLEIYETLAQRMPDMGDAHHVLGYEYQKRGRFHEAIHEYRLAMTLGVEKPAGLFQRLAWVYQVNGEYAKSIYLLRAGMDEVSPDQINDLAGQLAILLAECPVKEIRDGKEAVRLAQLACPKSGPKRAYFLDILTAAYLEAGMPNEAERTARLALREAESRNQIQLAEKIRDRLNSMNVEH